jgi:sigma-B regulation protein RsbU (phosphoserine phosphatase)
MRRPSKPPSDSSPAKLPNILAEFADLLSTNTLSLESLLPVFAELVRKIVDYELFVVLLRVTGSSFLEVTFATGPGARRLRKRRVRIGQGIAGSAAASRRILVVNDVGRDSRYIPAVDGVQAEMAVPLIARNRLVGVMDFEARRKGAFGNVERTLLRLIAARVGMVIGAARMYQETVLWNRTLRMLLQAAHEFATVLDVKRLLEHVAVVIRRLIRYDALSVFLLDTDAHMLRPYVSVRHDQRIGLGDVPVSKGIVGAAVRSSAPVLVSDTARDARYLPALEGIRSELAIPLIAGDKMAGVLDLESETRGFFTKEHLRSLSLLAPHLAASIENARLYDEVATHKARLEDDLTAARELQQSLLGAAPEFSGIQVCACNIPAAAVSGDFYTFLAHDTSILRIFMGDVSGKGAAAALFAALASGALHHLSSSGQRPSDLLRSLNQYLVARNAGRKYIAATVVDWRPASNCLRVSNAGGMDSIMVRNGRAEALRIEGMPLGLFAAAEYEQIELRGAPGDTLVLASDGILDCEDPGGHEYGIERLAQAISAHGGAPAREILQGILESVREHAAGAPPQDDQTLIVLKVQPGDRPGEGVTYAGRDSSGQ